MGEMIRTVSGEKAMSNQLQFYNAAKAALTKAKQVDEVKNIHDKAAAVKAAAKVAKDKTLEADAVEIRMRAERRLHELMKEQKKVIGFNKGGGDQRSKHRDSTKPGGNTKATLAEAGIDKNLAQRARNAGKPSDEEFEQKIADAKEQIESPVKLNIVTKAQKPKKVVIVGDAVDQCVNKVRAVIEDTLHQMRRGHAKQRKFELLFAGVRDMVDDLENKALPPLKSVEQSAEERRAVNAKLAEEDEKQKESAPA
jgi:hypothetical protein